MFQPFLTDATRRPDIDRQALAHYLLLTALLLAAASYWAPWIDHRSAALRLTGQDMGEFVKFLPVPQQPLEDERVSQILGRQQAPRQLFYLPPFVCTVCLMLLSVNRHLSNSGPRYPRWLQATALICATVLLLGLLPPVWGHPKELLAGEFRLQGYAIIFGVLLILGHGLFRNFPLHLLALTVSVLSLIALTLTQSAFWLVRSRLWAAYNTPTISLGWGLWLHIAAWAAAIGLGAHIYIRRTLTLVGIVRE